MIDAKQNMRRSRIAAAGLALALAAGSVALTAAPGVARADSLEELQQRIEESNASYDQAQQRVEDLRRQIEDNEERIAQIEAELPQKKEAAADSIRVMYKMRQGSSGLIDLLLSSDDFNDVITTLRYLDTVTAHNNGAINDLVDLDTELEQTRSALASEKSQADSDAQSAKDALASAVSAREDLEAQMAAKAAAEEAERQAAIQAAQQAAEQQAAAQKAADDANASADASDSCSSAGGGTFSTGTGSTATVEVPSSPDPGTVDWSSDKQNFVSSWGSRIDAYLAGSPLSGYGKTFAEAAWAYGVDPRFSPAISCVESTKGAYCFKPHNAWGWGSSSWSTWEDAIWDHVAGLAAGYDGHLTYAAAKKYCPPNADFWYSTVLAQMELI